MGGPGVNKERGWNLSTKNSSMCDRGKKFQIFREQKFRVTVSLCLRMILGPGLTGDPEELFFLSSPCVLGLSILVPTGVYPTCHTLTSPAVSFRRTVSHRQWTFSLLVLSSSPVARQQLTLSIQSLSCRRVLLLVDSPLFSQSLSLSCLWGKIRDAKQPPV